MHLKHPLLAALFCAVISLLPQVSPAQDIGRLILLDTLAQREPQLALRQTDFALRDPEVLGTPPDMRVLLDLLKLRAELLQRLGRRSEAAEAWATLGQTQAVSRKDLGQNPVPAFEIAATLHEADGAFGPARRAIESAIAAEQQTGRGKDRVLALYDRLLALANRDGDTEAAEAARAAIEALRAPGLETLTPGENGFVAIDVYYATDRARTGRTEPTAFYGSGRNDRIELGIATVTIPDTHQPGQVERPSIWRLEFRESASDHVLLKSVEPVSAGAFFGRLRGEFQDDRARDLFVFVHGFNTSFEYAAQRTAQMAHDMGDSTVPVMFSWPSRDTTVGYIADAAVVRLSGRRLAVFLEDLVKRSGAQTIHVVSHSMGTRALSDALEIMALKRNAQAGDTPLFGQVMFAAPDIDAQLFAAMARVFRPLAERMTLYASSTDWALVSSRTLHGSAPRAGLGGADLVPTRHFDSVDMTSLGEDMLAHNYFSNDSSALADIVTLFWHDTPPERRCGLQARNTDVPGTVYAYTATSCPSNDLIGVIANLRHENTLDPERVRSVVTKLLSEQSRMERILRVLERILLGT